jgi:hypothetical protein
VEKAKLLKFILKLNLSFLKNHKFVEAAFCDKEFNKELDIDFILGREFKINNQIFTPLNFTQFLDRNSNLNEELIFVYFIIVFTQYVIRLYYDYLDLCKEVKSDKLPKEKIILKHKVKCFNFRLSLRPLRNIFIL